jgi:hypothetical protein
VTTNYFDYAASLLGTIKVIMGADPYLTITAGTYGIVTIRTLPSTKNQDEVEVYAIECPLLAVRVTAVGPAEPIGSGAYSLSLRARVYIAVHKTPDEGLALVEQIKNRVIYVLTRMHGSTIGSSTTTQIMLDSCTASDPKPATEDPCLAIADVVAVYKALRCD